MTQPERFLEAIRILIVEDETAIANLLSTEIENSRAGSVSSEVTGSLAGALKALGTGTFDLVILDLGLPDSEGVATLERVKHAAPETPVVVLTGLSDPTIGTTCIEMGAQNYLVKGDIGSTISSVVQNTIATRVAIIQTEEAHENLKHVLDSSLDAILVIEDNGEVRFANRTAKGLFSGRVSEGQNIGLLLDAGDSLELEVPQPDGSLVKVEMHSATTSWFGKPSRVVSFRDITERATAEEALSASEAALSEAQRVAKIGSWEYDVAEDRPRWSREMFRIFGRDPALGEPTWKDHHPHIHPEDWERLDLAIQNAIKQGASYRLNFRIGPGDERITWVETIGHALQDESGQVVKLFGTVQDITEQYLAQKELQKLINEQNAILDNISSYIYFKDTENNIIQVSKSVADIAGLLRHQIAGRPLREIYPELADRYWEDDLEVINSGIAKRDILEQLSAEDGSVRWLLTDKIPYVDDKGEVQGIIVIATDVSSLIQAEEALARSEQKWRNILLNTPQLGISLDLSGSILFANRHFQEITGWQEEEIIGKDWFDTFIPESDRKEIIEIFAHTVHEKEVERFSRHENEILTKSGKRINVAWANALSMDQHGNVTEINCLGIDLTERIEAENELRKQQNLFETMFNTIPDGVVITDTERKILFANQGMENIFGHHPHDIVGESTKILYATDGMFEETGSTVFNREKEKTDNLYITRYKKADGTEFSGETFGAKLLDANGDWIGNLGIMRDITRREQSERQVADQLDELRRWHEITMGRESRIIKLKREVNELLTKEGRLPRYQSVLSEDPGTESTD